MEQKEDQPALEQGTQMEKFHPEAYAWEINSWAGDEGGYMIWLCCRFLDEKQPGC